MTSREKAAIQASAVREPVMSLTSCQYCGGEHSSFACPTRDRVRLVLIGCGKAKLATAAPARDLYTGPLFRAAVADVEARGLPWAIVSAEHGLVEPTDEIKPYDLTIEGRRKRDQTAYAGGWSNALNWGGPWSWPSNFVAQLVSRVWWGTPTAAAVAPRGTPVVLEVHAGRPYIDAIRAGLFDAAPGADDSANRDHWAAPLVTIEEPLRGMEIGERLGWYATRRRTNPGEQLGLFREAA